MCGLGVSALVAIATPARADDPRADRPNGGASTDHEFKGFEVGDFVLRPMIETRVRGEYRRDPMNDGIYGEHPVLRLDLPTTDIEPVRDQLLAWERVRLGLEVDWGPLTGRISFQDVRSFGDPAQNGQLAGQPDLPITEPYEGYLQIHTKERDVVFRLGRQAVKIGDGRLIGISDDRAPGRSLDAARLVVRVGDWDLQALAAMLVFPGEPTVRAPDDTDGGLVPGAQLYALDATWRIAPFFAAELTGIARIVRQPLVDYLTPSDTFVAAGRLFGDYRGVRWSVLGAFEGGRVALEGQEENATLIAGAVAGRVEWETALPWHLTFGAQGAYATGKPAAGDTPTEIGVFDPILPDTTRHFGQYDFYALSNLIEGGADVSIRPVEEFAARAGYRFAGLADAKGPWFTSALFPVGQSSTNDNQIMGHVITAELEARPWDPLRINIAYGIMVLGEGAKQIYLDSRPNQPGLEANDFAEFLTLDARLDLP